MTVQATSATPSATATATATATSAATPAATDATQQSCGKCARVLRQLMSSIDLTKQDLVNGSSSGGRRRDKHKEPAPITLLKAISNNDKSKAASKNRSSSTSSRQQQEQQQREDGSRIQMDIEDTPFGVRIKMPVIKTDFNLLRRYSSLLRDDEITEDAREAAAMPGRSGITLPGTPMAISSSSSLQRQPPQSVPQQQQTQTARNNPQPSQPTEMLEIDISCRKCADTGPEGSARAFLKGPRPLSIVLCENRIQSNPDEITELLTHELIHFYDVQTLRLDLSQCQNLAYTETRAAKYAECRSTWAPMRDLCAESTATRATKVIFPQSGRSCVRNVFAKAYNDNRPFDK